MQVKQKYYLDTNTQSVVVTCRKPHFNESRMNITYSVIIFIHIIRF